MFTLGKNEKCRPALALLLALGVAGSALAPMQAFAQSQSGGSTHPFVGGDGTATGGDATGGDASLSGGPGVSVGGSATAGSATVLGDGSATGGDATGGSASVSGD